MLIASPRHSKRDLDRWAVLERSDAVVAEATDWRKVAGRALDEIEEFASQDPCLVSLSWGKDSTVLAHLAWRLEVERGVRLPCFWVELDLLSNPDCHVVRDTFLARFPLDYHQETIRCWVDDHGAIQPKSKTLELGTQSVSRRLGHPRLRYISGVRAQESAVRHDRMRRYGIGTRDTCAPIGWWKAREVYAYLYLHNLPVHPAYACLQGGLWDRERVRVGPLTRPGTHLRDGDGYGHGRLEWEETYYREEMRAIQRMCARSQESGSLF